MNLYLLSVIQPDGPRPPPEVLAKVMRNVDVFQREIKAAGAWVFNGGLHPPSTATVVRLQDGEVLMTDGPFAEGKEHIGGFMVIKAPDLDAALEWGRKARARRRPCRSRCGRSRTSPRTDAAIERCRLDRRRDRAGVPRGVRPRGGRPGPRLRRHRRRRGGGPGRIRRRRCSGGRPRDCRRARRGGSSPPPATGRSTASAARRSREDRHAQAALLHSRAPSRPRRAPCATTGCA